MPVDPQASVRISAFKWVPPFAQGHVRDLTPKDGSVRPDEDFAMTWEVDARGQTSARVGSAARFSPPSCSSAVRS